MDKPITEFATEDEAYDYAAENKACVYDPDTMNCVFCRRWDH